MGKSSMWLMLALTTESPVPTVMKAQQWSNQPIWPKRQMANTTAAEWMKWIWNKQPAPTAYGPLMPSAARCWPRYLLARGLPIQWRRPMANGSTWPTPMKAPWASLIPIPGKLPLLSPTCPNRTTANWLLTINFFIWPPPVTVRWAWLILKRRQWCRLLPWAKNQGDWPLAGPTVRLFT